MEYALLYKVGMIIKGLVWSGYGLSGGYVVATISKYIRDYKEYVERDSH